MDIQKEKEAFRDWFKSLNENGRTTYFLGQESKVAWEAWQAAKANAVPEWVDYEKQCPECDGDYLIYACDEIRVATYLSKFGFVGVDDGCAYIQDLISHWSNRPQPPKVQEPSHD